VQHEPVLCLVCDCRGLINHTHNAYVGSVYLRKLPRVGCTQLDMDSIQRTLKAKRNEMQYWQRLRLSIWNTVFSPSTWFCVVYLPATCVMSAFYPRLAIVESVMGMVWVYTTDSD
jgi:hypothetical protein